MGGNILKASFAASLAASLLFSVAGCMGHAKGSRSDNSADSLRQTAYEKPQARDKRGRRLGFEVKDNAFERRLMRRGQRARYAPALDSY